MAYTKIDEFSSMHLDVLREIGNIGSGNAATALASLLNTVVDIEVPVISLISYAKVADYLGGKDTKALGMTVGLEGDIHGCMLEVVHLDFAKTLINTFYPKDIKDLTMIDDMDISVVREMSNITTAAYVNSIAAMTQLFINIQPPDSYCDNVSALVSIPAEKLSRSYDEPVLYIDEKLHIGDTEMNSGLILVLDSQSIQILFKKLGMPYL